MPEPPTTLLILPRTKADALGTERLRRIARALGPEGTVITEVVDSPTDIPVRIVELSDRIDAVAIGGGDGTLSTAASALVDTGLPACILPLGTANDLARTLGVPLDPERAAALRRHGRVEDIDVGSVNGHYFFNAAGIGLSVDVAERLARGDKRMGPLSYLVALLDIVRARRAFRARIVCDADSVVVTSIQVSVGNGRQHGGGVIVHQNAGIDDGWLDVYSLEPLATWRLPFLFSAFMRGTHAGWRSVTTLRGRSVRVETPGKPKRVNADGEIVARTPAEFRVHRNAVNVFRPA